MTVDEYLAWSERQTEKYRTELINGQVVAIAPELVLHNRIKGAIYIALRAAVAAAKLLCEVITDGVTVRIDEHTAYEPDALIYCGDRLPGHTLIVPNPMVIAEVLSPATAHTDTSAKLIAHYLIVDPDALTVTHYVRDRTPRVLNGGPLRLDPPGIDLTVEDLLGA